MEKRGKKIYKTRQYSSYIEGSAARQLQVPEREIKNPKKKVDRRVRLLVKNNRENIKEFGLAYMLFFATVTVIIAVTCVIYLNCQAEITASNKKITALTSEIDTLTAQNDSISYSINCSTDNANIIKRATEELGMVRASGSQIIYYDSTESEFMKQFADVPVE